MYPPALIYNMDMDMNAIAYEDDAEDDDDIHYFSLAEIVVDLVKSTYKNITDMFTINPLIYPQYSDDIALDQCNEVHDELNKYQDDIIVDPWYFP